MATKTSALPVKEEEQKSEKTIERYLMGRNLSPILQRELANLDKDAESRKLAMEALKSYVRDLDSKAIPVFLAQVSETKETGCVSGEYTISLYEVLARVHGVKIVPQIDSIMSTIVKTLASSAGSFPLQQACSKVVPAIARYGIDPTTPEDKKRRIIHSLCRPLSESLLGSQESLSSGAALCLKALVESDNWRFASDEMVNKVCQNVAGALEENTQTNPHMGLVMAIAKHNALIVEAYARLLIKSGLRISNAGLAEGNSQKQFSAIQMINFLMKCLDPRSIFSELELIMEEMEKFESDQNHQMPYVKGAAYEALQTAKKIAQEEESKFENGSSSVSGSNFGRREHSHRRNSVPTGDRSPATASPESQTLGSFMEDDSLLESPPVSMTQISHNMEYDQRSVNRKHWSYENGGLDLSLKDGSIPALADGRSMSDSPSNHHELSNCRSEYREEFAGSSHRSSRIGLPRSATPSPQRSRSRINVDHLFTTPRKLIHFLQDPIDFNSDYSEKQSRRFRSPCSEKFQSSPTTNHNCFRQGMIYEIKGNGHVYSDGEDSEKQSRRFRSPCSEKFRSSPTTNHNRFRRGMIYEIKGNGHMYTDGEDSQKQSRRFRSPCSEKFRSSPTTNHNCFRCGMIYEIKGNGHKYADGDEFQPGSESVSSTDDSPADVDVQRLNEPVPVTKIETQEFQNEKARKKTSSKMLFGLLLTIVIAVFTSLWWTEVQDESFYVVPT